MRRLSELAEVAELLTRGEREGSVQLSRVERLAVELELDDDEVEALYEEIDERGITLRDDFAREGPPGPRYENGELAAATADSLQLFLGARQLAAKAIPTMSASAA